jgi:hypothetical protein
MIGVLGALVVVLAGAAFAGSWFLWRSDAPPEADIETVG